MLKRHNTQMYEFKNKNTQGYMFYPVCVIGGWGNNKIFKNQVEETLAYTKIILKRFFHLLKNFKFLHRDEDLL